LIISIASPVAYNVQWLFLALLN